jgi:hypothetical protein
MNGRQFTVDRQLGIAEKCDRKRDERNVRDDVADSGFDGRSLVLARDPSAHLDFRVVDNTVLDLPSTSLPFPLTPNHRSICQT